MILTSFPVEENMIMIHIQKFFLNLLFFADILPMCSTLKFISEIACPS